jgi:hypothetical protein
LLTQIFQGHMTDDRQVRHGPEDRVERLARGADSRLGGTAGLSAQRLACYAVGRSTRKMCATWFWGSSRT